MVGIGQVEVTGVNVNPTEVTPGGTVDVVVILTETAEFVGPFGKLRLCNPDGLNTTGLEVESVVKPSWRSELSRVVCVGVSNIGSGEAEITYRLTAPDEPRQYDVDAFIRSTKNNQESQPQRNTITVSSGSGASEDPRDENVRGGGGINLPAPGGGNGGSGLGGLNWVVNNPVKTAVGAGVGLIVLRTATETATEELV
jgi:hypothetical protein